MERPGRKIVLRGKKWKQKIRRQFWLFTGQTKYCPNFDDKQTNFL